MECLGSVAFGRERGHVVRQAEGANGKSKGRSDDCRRRGDAFALGFDELTSGLEGKETVWGKRVRFKGQSADRVWCCLGALIRLDMTASLVLMDASAKSGRQPLCQEGLCTLLVHRSMRVWA